MGHRWETFDHTADIGLRVTANSVEELFVGAGQGLMGLMVENASEIHATCSLGVNIRGQRLEDLLLDWLNELLYLFEVRHLVAGSFAVTRTPEGIAAQVGCESVDRRRHRLAHEVKAVTYHGLQVRQEAGQWTAEVILDI